MFYVQLTINFRHHIGCDGDKRRILTVCNFKEVGQPPGTVGVHVTWNETHGIRCVGRESWDDTWEYTFSCYDRIPTIREIHLAMIVNNKNWMTYMLDGTKEMVSLHKMIWDV